MKRKTKPTPTLNIKEGLPLKAVSLFLDECIRTHEPVYLLTLTKEGEVRRYDGWQVTSANWRGGTHMLMNVSSRQRRRVRDVLIFAFNNHPVYI